MHFYAIETRHVRVLRSNPVLFDKPLYLGGIERPRGHERFHPRQGHRLARRPDRRGRNRIYAVRLKIRVRNPPDMPHLENNSPTGFMDRVGDFAPAVNLCIGMDARRAGVSHTFGTNLGCLGNYKSRIRTLLVIGCVQRRRCVALARPVPRHRRHYHPVRQLERPCSQRRKQICHDLRSTRACSSSTAQTAAVSDSACPCSSAAR